MYGVFRDFFYSCPSLCPCNQQTVFLSTVENESVLYLASYSGSYFCLRWKDVGGSSSRRSVACVSIKYVPARGFASSLLINLSGHEDCFMDVPRLSTIQALLLLLKARESAPKRGYYYRSWMTVKKLITMAHDLELHEHYNEHKAGQGCELDPTECLIRTRIWQNIFICEIMIGGPQGTTQTLRKCVKITPLMSLV